MPAEYTSCLHGFGYSDQQEVSGLDVMVIGCGVIGLTAAIRLRESGLDAYIQTAALPHETTSSVAAAIWYPYKAYPEDRVLEWGKRAFEVFEEMARNKEGGVLMREGTELYRKPVPAPWWGSAVPGVRRCAADELPSGYRDGHIFTAPVIEMPVYLEYLMDRFTASGGTVEQRVFSSLEEAGKDAPVIVNCTGLGARELVGDDRMAPIRGQVIRVENPGLENFALDEDDPEGVTYIVPRSGDCILGGTADEGNRDTEPDPKVAESILRRCIRLEPRLEGVEVLEHKVGLRPGRSEIRLELEELPNGARCVHNYGHGGSGVTLSWGCAEETLGLVREALGR